MFLSLFCSPCLSGRKMSFHFIKSLLSIQYVLGTLLDASNTKMKSQTKYKRNKIHFLTPPTSPTPRKVNLASAGEAGPGPSGIQHQGTEYSRLSSHPTLIFTPASQGWPAPSPSLSPAFHTCLSNLPCTYYLWMRHLGRLGEQFRTTKGSCSSMQAQRSHRHAGRQRGGAN